MSIGSQGGPSGAVTGEWECDECGYSRRGTLRSRPARCPECGAPGDAFSFWSDDDDEDLENWDEEDEDWDEEDEDWDDDDDDEDDF